LGGFAQVNVARDIQIVVLGFDVGQISHLHKLVNVLPGVVSRYDALHMLVVFHFVLILAFLKLLAQAREPQNVVVYKTETIRLFKMAFAERLCEGIK
jgi:hypothetical protein